jgi:hypothetical protein
MHSLTLDPREDLEGVKLRISKAKPAEEIALMFPPISVNVELLNVDLSKYGPGDTLIPGRAVIPIFLRSRSRFEPVKSWELLNRINPIDGVRFRSHGVEPEFACTMEKGQSKTLASVIIDLNCWPGMHLSFEKLNVALTRVKTCDDIRLLPTLPGQNLDHLFSLRPDPRMLVWRAGFGSDGMWDPELCKAAMDLLPPDFFKKRKQKRSNKQQKPASQEGNDGSGNCNLDKGKSGTKHNCDSGEKGSAPFKKGKSSESCRSSSAIRNQVIPAVTATFKLDHPVPGTRTRTFKSFDVLPDGDCLFHSVIRLLNLSMPVAVLRTQVVEYMDGLPAVDQINILNEHLLRDPSWHNERCFEQGIYKGDGAGAEVLVLGDEVLLDSASLLDIHGDRFHRLWLRYKSDMSDNSWGGNAELAAIKDLYSVSVVVWQIGRNGVAHQVNRIDVGLPDSATLHLCWVNERHYETTDIPARYLPLPSVAPIPALEVDQPAARVSGRTRRPRCQMDL